MERGRDGEGRAGWSRGSAQEHKDTGTQRRKGLLGSLCAAWAQPPRSQRQLGFLCIPRSQAGGPAEAHGEEAGLAEEHYDGSQDALGLPGHSFSSILSEQNQGTHSRRGPATGSAGLWHAKAFQTQGMME